MAILTSTQYPAIRAAIDVSLTTADLPDAIIGLDIYKTMADNDVLEIYPGAESATGSAAIRVMSAAIFFCAARLCPAVVRVTSLSVQTRDISMGKQTFDPTLRAAELRQLAVDELDEILAPSDVLMPIMFTSVGGDRGR